MKDEVRRNTLPRKQKFFSHSSSAESKHEKESEEQDGKEDVLDVKRKATARSVRDLSDERRISNVYMRYNKSRVVIDSSGRFQNPWPSWIPMTFRRGISWWFSRDESNVPRSKRQLDTFLPLAKPSFESIRISELIKRNYNTNSLAFQARSPVEELQAKTSCLRVTWLGHSCLLVEIDGVTILTDPVLSTSSSFLFRQCFMPRRIRPAPCSVSELPATLDVVLISHNHYDHLDERTVLDLHARYGTQLHWVVPKGLKGWFARRNIRSNVIEASWWEEYSLSLVHSNKQRSRYIDGIRLRHKEEVNASFLFPKLVCLPAQHWSGRCWFDNNRSLWASYAIVGHTHRFFFAGDTGYCEAFQQIGTLYGPFDLAALPIGAYGPERYARSQHMTPEDAVQAHVDLCSKRSVAIHWGTFVLGKEFFYEPVIRLRAALKKNRMDLLSFSTMMHGETKDLSRRKFFQ